MHARAPSHAPTTRPAAAASRARPGTALLLAAALCAPGAARAYDKVFNAGSLIISAQQEYQSDSGMVSAYGLVYTLLFKNGARVAAGQKPITIYWTIQPKKQSHHRCWTGNDVQPDYTSFNDNDACDFTVQSNNGSPVARLDNLGNEVSPFWACGLDASNTANITRNPSNCDPGSITGAGGTTAVNKFPAFGVDPSKKVMKYSGGQWVIDAVDRNDVMKMLLTDPDLAPYHLNGTCGNTNLGAGCHYVNIHSARASFTAPVARVINVKPPLIALLGAGAVNILQAYLSNAGLDNIPNFAGPLARDPLTGAITQHGVIYDVLNPVLDFVSKSFGGALGEGILNQPLDGVDPLNGTFYQVLWAPHWVAPTESSIPRDGDPGDDRVGDGAWTHNGDDPITNALKNISWFADQGNGVFAECASLESFEGSYKSYTSACNTTYACELSTDTTQTTPYQCPAGYTAACNACYSCPAGQNLDASSCAELKCVGNCPAGSTAACNTCYSCPAGYTVNALTCNAVTCNPSPCPAGYTSVCGGCYSCSTGYTMVSDPACFTAPVCHQCKNNGYFFSPGLGQCINCTGGNLVWNETTLQCFQNGTLTTYQTGTELPPQPALQPSGPAPTAVAPTVLGVATSSPATCASGYQLFCPGVSFPVDVPGNPATHFHMTDGLIKNGLGNSFSGPDCTDRTSTVVGFHDSTTGDCLDFHPEVGGPGNIFAQKGNFSYSGTSGHVHQYMPPQLVGSQYWPNVFRMVTSRNSLDSTRDNWDFASSRHKDGDPSKGMVIYLAGHTYNNNPAGTRWVLNTLLNLGFSSFGVELARSEPVGYVDANWNPSANHVYQGSYVQLPPPGPFQDWAEYTVGSPQSWRFPYTTGHLYEYTLSSLTATQQLSFKTGSNWDAGALMPLPGNRTIFTALGGSANLGWTTVNFNYTETQPGCVDVNGNGKCDLSEQLAACTTAGVTTATLQAVNVAGAQRDALGMFVSQVRGFCSAHSPAITGSAIFQPADSQCDNLKQQRNRAKLGGIDHASPAVVGPSRYVTDAPWNSRPVVAYVGARDGMLHAIYVSGGKGWQDPQGNALPQGIVPGQELWAFVPPGQICGLATNNAMVDASPNVIDVFGNFPVDANGDGVIDWTNPAERPTGVKTWRTVLLSAAGQGGSELFAMDVTNPLKPILLWHVGGATEHDGRWDVNGDGIFGSTEVFDPNDQRTYAWQWQDTPAANGVTKVKTGRFDYRNLGLTYGTAVGKVWEGNAFRYLGYVATSSADFTDPSAPLGYKGVEVFAFDLLTGQKLWQWERRYTRSTPGSPGVVIADNTIPGRLALADVDVDGSVDRVYVGDLEGHLWELDAISGGNLNYLRSKIVSTNFYSFPLFGAPDMLGTAADPSGVTADPTTLALFTVSPGKLAQQPLTSPIGLGRFSLVPTAPKDLTTYIKGRLSLIQGTMGVGWAIAPFEYGHVFTVPAYWEQPSRIAYFTTGDSVDETAVPDPRLYGLIRSAAVWDIPLGQGERVFGIPRIVNDHIIFNTSYGPFTGDITNTLTDKGNMYVAYGNTTTVTANVTKAFGGVLVFQNQMVVTTATGISARPTPAGLTSDTPAQRAFNRATPAIFKTWEPPDSAVRPP